MDRLAPQDGRSILTFIVSDITIISIVSIDNPSILFIIFFFSLPWADACVHSFVLFFAVDACMYVFIHSLLLFFVVHGWIHDFIHSLLLFFAVDTRMYSQDGTRNPLIRGRPLCARRCASEWDPTQADTRVRVLAASNHALLRVYEYSFISTIMLIRCSFMQATMLVQNRRQSGGFLFRYLQRGLTDEQSVTDIQLNNWYLL